MSDKATTTQDHQDPQGELKDAQRQQAGEHESGAADTMTDEQEPTDQQDDPKGGGNKEAAKYRRQLRETETERDGLASTVETLRRQVIAQTMPQAGELSAEALWAVGKTAADFYNEAGELDNRKLRMTVDEVRRMVGLPPIGYVPEAGRGQGSGLTSQPTWSDALKR